MARNGVNNRRSLVDVISYCSCGFARFCRQLFRGIFVVSGAAEKAVSCHDEGVYKHLVLEETADAFSFYQRHGRFDTLADSSGLERSSSGWQAVGHALETSSAGDGLGPDDLYQRQLRGRTLCHRARLLCRPPSTGETAGPDLAGFSAGLGQVAAAAVARLVRRPASASDTPSVAGAPSASSSWPATARGWSVRAAPNSKNGWAVAAKKTRRRCCT